MDRLERVLAFRPEWSGTSWVAMLHDVLQGPRLRCVLGKHGAGKTTLLDGLAARLAADGHPVQRWFFNDHLRVWNPLDRELTPQTIAIVDGDMHLSWMQRYRMQRFLASARVIVLCRHHAFGAPPVLCRLSPNLDVLHACVRIAAPEYFGYLEPSLEHWFRLERQNLRHVLRHCYDAVAALP